MVRRKSWPARALSQQRADVHSAAFLRADHARHHRREAPEVVFATGLSRRSGPDRFGEVVQQRCLAFQRDAGGVDVIDGELLAPLLAAADLELVIFHLDRAVGALDAPGAVPAREVPLGAPVAAVAEGGAV